VAGAWACFGDHLKFTWSHRGVSSDDGITHSLDSNYYMETVEFIGHRALLPQPSYYNTYYLLYRIEGHPNGQHIRGYQEIEIDPGSGLIYSETTTYCWPIGHFNCDLGLPPISPT
jgi:hypothetical protein